MNTPTQDVRIDIATCPSCTCKITAKAVVRVKVEQPKPNPLEGVGAFPGNADKPVGISVTATPIIVGLDIDHHCGEAKRIEETR